MLLQREDQVEPGLAVEVIMTPKTPAPISV